MSCVQLYSFRQLAQRFVCCLSLLTALFLLAPPTLCAAQHKPLVSGDLDNKVVKVDVKAATLEAMVALLAKQINCNIVMDDSPHHEPIDFTMEITARKALDRIASAYDYEWRLTRQGIVVLNKRFADPTEFPQMNIAEWKQTAKEVQQIAGEHDFVAGPRLILHPFVSGLTHAQWADVLAHKHLFVSALEEKQVAILREYFYVRLLTYTVFAWQKIYDNLTMLSGSSLQMRPGDDLQDIFVSKQEHRQPRQVLTLFIDGKYKDGSPLSHPLYSQTAVSGERTVKTGVFGEGNPR